MFQEFNVTGTLLSRKVKHFDTLVTAVGWWLYSMYVHQMSRMKIYLVFLISPGNVRQRKKPMKLKRKRSRQNGTRILRYC